MNGTRREAMTGMHTDSAYTLDLRDVRGQMGARRALEIAAAGGHHLLMMGPPGCGKSMLAMRLPGLLPAGAGGAPCPLRAPHHTASATKWACSRASSPKAGQLRGRRASSSGATAAPNSQMWPRVSDLDDGRVHHRAGEKRNRDASLSPGERLRGTGAGSGADARHDSAGRVESADTGVPPRASIRAERDRCNPPRSTAGPDHSASR